MEIYTIKAEPNVPDTDEQHFTLLENCKDENRIEFIKTTECTEIKTEVQPQQNIPTHKVKQTRKRQKKPIEPLTDYLKKKCLQNFQDEDCTRKCLDNFIKEHNTIRKDVIENFGESAKKAQLYVHQECDSLCFSNTTEWLKYLQSVGAHHANNYESAIIMNTIVNNEYHPKPDTLGGVKLKDVYKFLNNALMGLPQKPLDSVTAKFLSSEFENLINEANTDESDNSVRIMKMKLETSLSQNTDQPSSSLDPFKLYDNGKLLQRCQSAYCQRRKNIVKKEEK